MTEQVQDVVQDTTDATGEASQVDETPQEGTGEAAGSGMTLDEAMAELARVRKEAADRRVALREEREKNEALAKAQSEAEDKQLAEQQKYAELAEKRGAALKETTTTVETLTEQNTALKSRLSEYFENRTKDWPDEVKALQPETDDPDLLMAWADKAEPMVLKISKSKTGVPASPNGDKVTPDPDLLERARSAVERQYRRF